MSLKGNTNAEKIWNYFKSKGFTDFGTAGMMGNLYAESGLKPNNLQNTGNTKLGMTDDEYVAAIDNGTYTKDQFVYDKQGAFLAQWTYWSRKKALYEFMVSRGVSIGDLEMQLDFIYKELSEGYKSTLNILKTATSVRQASDAVLVNYECPGVIINGTEEQKEDTKKKRAGFGQTYYDQYATKTTTSTGLKYNETDIVDFVGTTHYISSNSDKGSTCKAGVAKVSKRVEGAKHPYHLIRTSGGGSTVYGWVDEASIKGLHKENTTEETDKQTGGTTMGYTNSSLVSYTKISPNRTSPRNHKIDCITIHCVVGQCSVETLGNIFAPTSRQASSNYGVGYDGRIGMYVEEKDRSWCSSNAANDHRAITIEVASDTTHPYAVKDKALAALIELVADICKRNGIKKLVWSTNKSDRVNHKNGCNMTVHRDYANKSCPGDYLYNKHGYIAAEVNKRLGVTESTTPAPTTPTPAPSTSKLQFKEGDIVNFAGGKHYGSASAANGTNVKASKAKVTSTYEAGKHPYHLRAVNDKGAFISGVYGWVDASTVSAIKTETPKPTTPAPSTPAVTTITAGTKLTLKNVALYASSGAATKAATRSGTYYVWSKDVINNRIRITNSTANVGKSGQVTGWISYADAKNAAGVTSATPATFTPYKVKVTASSLNIRKGAGTNYGIRGSIKDKGVYTIVGESSGTGATKWGLLKSYEKNRDGWVSLDYVKKI